MEQYKGKSIFSKTTMGKIFFYEKKASVVTREKITNPQSEIERVDAARKIAIDQLSCLYEKAVKEVGESGAAIFEAHQMILDDIDYCESIHTMIRQEHVNGEYAVAVTGDNFSQMFASMDNDYMRERAADGIENRGWPVGLFPGDGGCPDGGRAEPCDELQVGRRNR